MQPNDATPALPPVAAIDETPPPPAGAAAPAPVPPTKSHATQVVMGMLAVGVVGAAFLAWQAQSRVNALERELVRRQASSQSLAETAQAAAQKAEDQVRELSAKVALTDARLAEAALQRGQLEELMSALSRSRDENVVGDLEASLRVASQQAALVGSIEPLVSALRQADERIQRYKQPRLETVRRALLRDIDRLKAAGSVDAANLALRLDEVSRLVDDLPLLSEPHRQDVRSVKDDAALPPEPEPKGAWARWTHWMGVRSDEVWQEAKGLVRVTRIESPEAMFVSPDQAIVLRENFKLRLLNARLALLSRQYETARLDLEACIRLTERHGDPRQRKTQIALELMRQVLAQARPHELPRADDSLAALAALAVVR